MARNFKPSSRFRVVCRAVPSSGERDMPSARGADVARPRLPGPGNARMAGGAARVPRGHDSTGNGSSAVSRGRGRTVRIRRLRREAIRQKVDGKTGRVATDGAAAREKIRPPPWRCSRNDLEPGVQVGRLDIHRASRCEGGPALPATVAIPWSSLRDKANVCARCRSQQRTRRQYSGPSEIA